MALLSALFDATTSQIPVVLCLREGFNLRNQRIDIYLPALVMHFKTAIHRSSNKDSISKTARGKQTAVCVNPMRLRFDVDDFSSWMTENHIKHAGTGWAYNHFRRRER